MKKYFLLALILLAILLSSGCIQPQPAVEPVRVEKYGFSLAPPQSTAWLDWKNIPFGETLFQAMGEGMGGEPMLILIKSESGDANGMSVIAVMLADNNSGYNDVGQIPQEALQSGSLSMLGFSGGGAVQKMGALNWVAMEAEVPEPNSPFMSNIAVTICGNKVAALILMNGLEGLEENRDYFTQLAESGQCKSQ